MATTLDLLDPDAPEGVPAYLEPLAPLPGEPEWAHEHFLQWAAWVAESGGLGRLSLGRLIRDGLAAGAPARWVGPPTELVALGVRWAWEARARRWAAFLGQARTEGQVSEAEAMQAQVLGIAKILLDAVAVQAVRAIMEGERIPAKDLGKVLDTVLGVLTKATGEPTDRVELSFASAKTEELVELRKKFLALGAK